MMKTIKHIIWMAALSLTAATWTACSNEDEPVTEQPAQSRTFTVTTTLSPRNGAATRSTMTDNGDGSISAEWEVGDQIWVLYEDNSDTIPTTIARVTAVDPSTKAATITMTLTDPKDGGNIQFGYPLSFYNSSVDPDNDQIGTLDDINDNYAAISGSEAMTVSGSDVTLPAVTMEPEMCIWKFSFTDGTSDITSAITKLIIELPNSNKTYTVSPSSLSTIYVALSSDYVNLQPICITATTASGVYRKAVASITLDDGTTYTTTGFALKKAEVGKVFGEDGNIYDNATAATTAGTSAVAMITYVGSENAESSPYNHGLALAMSDANSGSACQWRNPQDDAGHTKQLYDSFTSESGLQYNATHDSDIYPAFQAAIDNNDTDAPTGCSAWFLPTGYQWNQMINACKNVLGTKNSYEDLRDGFSGVGGTNLQSSDYWSSSEESSSWAWEYLFDSPSQWYVEENGYSLYVRSALAF